MSKWLLFFMVGCLGVTNIANAQDAAPSATKPVTPGAKSSAQPAAKTPAKTSSKAASPTVSADRLDLETTVVTGNRELPKVLYIVPWKKADLGELPAQPFNTLLDEVLEPVDREVFKREVKYFQAVSAGVGTGAAAHQSGSTPPPVTAQ